MKRLINNFADMFSDISLTRSGMNSMIIISILWAIVLIVKFTATGSAGEVSSIASITATITSLMTTMGIAKHYKEK